jgi:hypothetical protein
MYGVSWCSPWLHTFLTIKPKDHLNGKLHSHRKQKKFFYIYRSSLFAPPVTRHTSIWYYSSSSHTRVNMGAFRLHTQPVSVNCLYHARLSCLWAGPCVLCKECTLHSNHRLAVWYSNTQKYFSPGAAIFSLHKPAYSSGRNVNYYEEQLTGKNFELFLITCTGIVITCPTAFI